MNRVIQVKTQNKNTYFYFRKSKLFVLVNPILSFLHQKVEKGINLSEFINTVNENLEIPLYRKVSKKELKYYYSKYFFYNNHFSDKIADERFKPDINSQDVEIFIANADAITFELTQKCNLSCDYCTYNDNFNWFDKRENKTMEVFI